MFPSPLHSYLPLIIINNIFSSFDTSNAFKVKSSSSSTSKNGAIANVSHNLMCDVQYGNEIYPGLDLPLGTLDSDLERKSQGGSAQEENSRNTF